MPLARASRLRGRGFLSLALRAWMASGCHPSPQRKQGTAQQAIARYPAQRPVAFMISSVRMIATPISDSPAISPLDTGTV